MTNNNQKYILKYTQIILNFLNDINRYNPNNSLTDILKLFKEGLIDINVISNSITKVLFEHKERIKNKDETLFDEEFIILEDIITDYVDISLFWKSLNEKRKLKLFLHMGILISMREIIDTKIDNNILGFNPFEGIQGKDVASLSVEELRNNANNLELDDESSLSSLFSFLGNPEYMKLINGKIDVGHILRELDMDNITNLDFIKNSPLKDIIGGDDSIMLEIMKELKNYALTHDAVPISEITEIMKNCVTKMDTNKMKNFADKMKNDDQYKSMYNLAENMAQKMTKNGNKMPNIGDMFSNLMSDKSFGDIFKN